MLKRWSWDHLDDLVQDCGNCNCEHLQWNYYSLALSNQSCIKQSITFAIGISILVRQYLDNEMVPEVSNHRMRQCDHHTIQIKTWKQLMTKTYTNKTFRERRHPRPAEIRKCEHHLSVAISYSDPHHKLHHATKFQAVMWFPQFHLPGPNLPWKI